MLLSTDRRERTADATAAAWPGATCVTPHLVHEAFRTSAQAHAGQRRQSGEAFICHPIAVASMLARFGCDPTCLVVGLLHDTVEDTAVTLEMIGNTFGSGIAELVSFMSKPGSGGNSRVIEFMGHYARKHSVGMASEAERRAMLVKLADRIHNVITLEALVPWRRFRCARETWEIFIPVARAFGLRACTATLTRYTLRYAQPRPRARQRWGLKTWPISPVSEAIGGR